MITCPSCNHTQELPPLVGPRGHRFYRCRNCEAVMAMAWEVGVKKATDIEDAAERLLTAVDVMFAGDEDWSVTDVDGYQELAEILGHEPPDNARLTRDTDPDWFSLADDDGEDDSQAQARLTERIRTAHDI